MTTKKSFSNGKSEVIANFFAQQLPSPLLKAYNVITSMKYPIQDKQMLCDQMDKSKEDESTKQMIMNIFAPCDFGLDSVYNALEKFTANINQVGMNNTWRLNQPIVNNWTGVPNTGNGMNNSVPVMNTAWGTTTPSHVAPVAGYPMTGTNSWNAWGTANTIPSNMTNTNWEFGNDICGEIACSLFCDMVSRGITAPTAYAVCNSKEIACRNVMPVWGNDVVSRKACSIFVHNFIVMGKDVNQCNWCVQFFVNNCVPQTNTTNTPTTGTSYTNVTPRFEQKITERVN